MEILLHKIEKLVFKLEISQLYANFRMRFESFAAISTTYSRVFDAGALFNVSPTLVSPTRPHMFFVLGNFRLEKSS